MISLIYLRSYQDNFGDIKEQFRAEIVDLNRTHAIKGIFIQLVITEGVSLNVDF